MCCSKQLIKKLIGNCTSGSAPSPYKYFPGSNHHCRENTKNGGVLQKLAKMSANNDRRIFVPIAGVNLDLILKTIFVNFTDAEHLQRNDSTYVYVSI